MELAEPIIASIVSVLVTLAVFHYRMGRREQRLVAWGRDSYIRFYPNPGVGFRVGRRRVAASVVGGLETYIGREARGIDGLIWVRTWSAFCRAEGKADAMRGLGGQ